MDDATAPERQRLELELELLEAMYPDQIQHDSRSNEVRYTSSTDRLTNSSTTRSAGVLVLRLPETYPEDGFPSLVSATDTQRNDVRRQTLEVLEGLRARMGEEVLDAVVQGFEAVLAETEVQDGDGGGDEGSAGGGRGGGGTTKTIVVWLHHLLNTNKRKLALSPSLNPTASAGGGGDEGKGDGREKDRSVSGITKPGYPGILVYSGPSDLVDTHVMELRQQRWQAFQVRFDQEFRTDLDGGRKAWNFEHGEGIKEVESMAEVVQNIKDPVDRETFLKATGVK